MSSGTFWSDACQNAVDRPLQTLLGTAFASCGVTVRDGPVLLLPPLLALLLLLLLLLVFVAECGAKRVVTSC